MYCEPNKVTLSFGEKFGVVEKSDDPRKTTVVRGFGVIVVVQGAFKV